MTSRVAPKPAHDRGKEQRAPDPDSLEQQEIDRARRRVSRRRARVRARVHSGAAGSTPQIGPDHSDHSGWLARVESAFGSRGVHFPVSQLSWLLATARLPNGDIDEGKLNALIAAVDGADPADELQAILAVQMVVTHELAMQVLHRAARVDQIPQFESAGNMAAKLLKVFAGHLELLAKLKRGGEQTVRVEHVHVHAGGQAIVGNVAPGGGAGFENRSQPHAPHDFSEPEPRSLGHDAGAAMPRADAERLPVPIASGQR